MHNFCAQPVQTRLLTSRITSFFAHNQKLATQGLVYKTAVFTKTMHSRLGFLQQVMRSFIRAFTDCFRYFYTLCTDLILTITT